ncbi:hypothetical protein Q0F98_00705 [Paenibacillus amylolyticus]|nr:hypothetical protein Q0F98_00705 [Paenibacillus amylolyticus]
MVVVITGEITASVFNPFTRERLTYRLKPGQVVVFPKAGFTGLSLRQMMYMY